MNNLIKVAIVDDHLIIQSGLKAIFKDEGNIEVVLIADHGMDMIDKLKTLKKSSFPDVFIIDVNMPIMGGPETVNWLNQHYPNSKIIMLTMIDKPEIVMSLIKLGVKSYLMKYQSSSDLLTAIRLVNDNKFYFPDKITGIIVASHQMLNQTVQVFSNLPTLTDRETEFLQLSCTEMTYAEIARKMDVSPRTIDVFRDKLYGKLNVKSRVGLVLVALKLRLITVKE